jgi:hypothetical protein
MRFTLRELLCAVLALAAYLAIGRHFGMTVMEDYESKPMMPWLVRAEWYTLVFSPFIAAGWAMARTLHPPPTNVATSYSSEQPEPGD